jgi:hypothetical protein
MQRKRKTKKKGVVEKIVKLPWQPEKAEISIDEADDLYREIRIENKLESEGGQPAKLKPGAQVEVTIEADEKDTTPASEQSPHPNSDK